MTTLAWVVFGVFTAVIVLLMAYLLFVTLEMVVRDIADRWNHR